ncbi:hypothetical protein TrRE_jg4033 [Triparma retinervis]|uniref:Phospholipase/carboxylesterase/thioesterase domain-containing protein n=1 Tax=Triparma retinervis TaxID=2557542 RepID=A0A9W6ZKN4_9STRA|nr:hypothetical protein TrRE_jg4033 [Triparma retinervis]
MATDAFVFGPDPSAYSTVVVLLHGGGGSSGEWFSGRKSPYQEGWFGEDTGIKYVFPNSALEGRVWYNSYKNGCGMDDDCAYDLDSIADSGGRVSDLIDFELGEPQIAGDASRVYVAGFSQGAQLAGYMQLGFLDYPLGGVGVMSGFPLPPLCDMGREGADPAEARGNASYAGGEANFFIWHGKEDQIFPVDFTEESYKNIFEVLGVEDELRVNVTNVGQTHEVVEEEIEALVEWVRGGH